MNRIERLSAILIHLQGKRVVRAAELAERFGISLRTVYRDIRSLEEAGVPIGAEAGTGYFLPDNYQLDPVSFTLHEASAMLMAEKLMNKMSDNETFNFYRSALFKIRAILKPVTKDYLESLSDAISVHNWATLSPDFNNLFLLDIQQAIARKHVLKIEYIARSSPEVASRLVEPIGLCNYGSRWHLIAWCRLRESYRDFRLDRVKSLEAVNESFDSKKHISINEYFSRHSFSSGEINIVFEISAEQNKLLSESKFIYGLKQEEELSNGIMKLSFTNNDLDGFARWLIATGAVTTIITPRELKDILTGKVRQLTGYLQ